jgi:hypothetical protein
VIVDSIRSPGCSFDVRTGVVVDGCVVRGWRWLIFGGVVMVVVFTLMAWVLLEILDRLSPDAVLMLLSDDPFRLFPQIYLSFSGNGFKICHWSSARLPSEGK